MQGETGAIIDEVFSSLQGEGPYTGRPMTFVRFDGCGLGCRWCDTNKTLCPNPICRVENPPGSSHFEEHPNPVTWMRLNEWMQGFFDDTVSVTGGEPLENIDFLASWLPTIRQPKKILLETNGILHEELRRIIEDVDIISMDIKLPSSTGCRPLWKEHAAFLSIALQKDKDLYIKMVVTDDTSDKDLQEAIKLIIDTNKFIPLIIQPVSPTPKCNTEISENRLNSIHRLCKAWLPNAEIRPQLHKMLGIL